MLKFSGFADLISCLGKIGWAYTRRALPPTKQQLASMMLFKLLVAEGPHVLDATGVCNTRPDTQIRTHDGATHVGMRQWHGYQ